MTAHPISRRHLVVGATVMLQAPAVGAQSAGVKAAPAARIRMAFKDHVVTATLVDNQTVLDLLSMLPLALTITDYSTNEKIAHLPRKLAGDDSVAFGDEAAGDVCYYAPWGNLAFFHAGYRFSRGLVRLGRLEGGVEPLLTRGDFPLRIERVG